MPELSTSKMCPMLLLTLLLNVEVVLTRESIWHVAIEEKTAENFFPFPNYLYKDSFVAVHGMLCNSVDKNLSVAVTWILVEMNCMQDMYNYQPEKQFSILPVVTNKSSLELAPQWEEGVSLNALPNHDSYTLVYFQPSLWNSYPCGDNHLVKLKNESNSPYYVAAVPASYQQNVSADLHIWKVPQTGAANSTKFPNRVARVWHTGMYHFLLSVVPLKMHSKFKVTAVVEMRSQWGYLPAINWPLLPYSGSMAVLYLLLGTVWMFIWIKTQEHTTKIHMVIGGVTVAGGMANTLLFVEENTVNSNGIGFPGLEWASSLLAFVQGGLTTALLLVVSTGYGINRPSLHRKLVIGFIVLAVVRVLTNLALMIVTDEQLRIQYKVPVVALVTSACYGVVVLTTAAVIMVFSVMTFVHLWKRRHSEQILMFLVFMLLCILIFVAEVFLLGTGYGWFSSCRKDWRYEWLFSNFGNMMTLPLLVALMWLWRPVDIAQSYAFVPLDTHEKLLNEEEDDNDEVNETEMLNNNKDFHLEELS